MNPYISFVVAGRNDNYGDDFNDRLNNSIKSLAYFVEKFKLPAEYIIVNYNPLSDRPSLQESLRWPGNRHYLSVRIITVPKAIHERFINPEIRATVPLFEYIAKNIGILRAKGEFVCAANPDIIYPEELVRFLAERTLQKDHFYRVDRCDFNKWEGQDQLSVEELIDEVKKRTFRIFMKGYRYPVHFPNFFTWRLAYQKWQNNRRLKKARKDPNQSSPPEFYYHCNCSGDFMLLHRSQWEALRGNPENTLVSAHTDALFVIIAATAGLTEKVLEWPVFHQNHGRRYTCDAEEVNPNVEIMYKRYLKQAELMIEQKRPTLYNDENWGLKKETLEEVEF